MGSSDFSSLVPLAKHFVSFVPRFSPGSVVRSHATRARRVSLDLIRGASVPHSSESDETSQVPRCPHARAPRSRTPVGSTTLAIAGHRCCDDGSDRRLLPRLFSFEAVSRGFALLVYASQSSSPTTTQHSVPAGRYSVAGQVHLLLRHFARFQFIASSSPGRSGATDPKIDPGSAGPVDGVSNAKMGQRAHRGALVKRCKSSRCHAVRCTAESG